MNPKHTNNSILSISYFFHPTRLVPRTSKMAKWMQKRGYHVYVLRASLEKLLGESDYLTDQESQSLNVFSLYPFDIRCFYHTTRNAINKILPSIRTPSIPPSPFIKKRLLSLSLILKSILRTPPFSFIASEGCPVFMLWGIAKGMFLIKKHKIRHIMSTSGPIVNHYIAFTLKLIFRKNIIWICEYRDPHGQRMSWPFRTWNTALDRYILRKSDVPFTVSQGMSKALSSPENTVSVISHGYDPDDYPTDTPPPHSPFVITYTGTLYEAQNLELFFHGLTGFIQTCKISHTLENIVFQYAGPSSHKMLAYIKKFNLLNDMYINHGYVSRKRALALQAASNVLLAASFQTPHEQGIITSKFIEYLPHNIPLLYLFTGPPDQEIVELNHAINFGLVVSDTEQDAQGRIESFLMATYLQHQTQSVYHVHQRSNISSFSFDNITQAILQKL